MSQNGIATELPDLEVENVAEARRYAAQAMREREVPPSCPGLRPTSIRRAAR